MSSDFRFEVQRALQRSKHTDLAATAAREGILGLPLTVAGAKAIRVYQKASEARTARNDALEARGKPRMQPGKTNYPDLDAQFAAQ